VTAVADRAGVDPARRVGQDDAVAGVAGDDELVALFGVDAVGAAGGEVVGAVGPAVGVVEAFIPARSRTSPTASVSVLWPLPLRSMRSIDSRREALPGVLAPWLAIAVRSNERPLPARAMVSIPRAAVDARELAALTPLASAARLLALRMKVSSPAPP
jgi:hypothetical protein